MRNARAPQAQAKLYQIVESFKKQTNKQKTVFSSACSRGPTPKWQVAKVLPSGYMAIAHTGKPHGPGLGDVSGCTLCPSEQASRPPQAGSSGQETNQVEIGALSPCLALKELLPSFCLYWKILGHQVLAAAGGQTAPLLSALVTVSSGQVLLCYIMVPSREEEGGAWRVFKRSFAKIRGRNVKPVLRSSK